MPQLMPLMWVYSSIMVLMFLVVMMMMFSEFYYSDMYLNSKSDLFKNKWLW